MSPVYCSILGQTYLIQPSLDFGLGKPNLEPKYKAQFNPAKIPLQGTPVAPPGHCQADAASLYEKSSLRQ